MADFIFSITRGLYGDTVPLIVGAIYLNESAKLKMCL